MRRSPIPVIAAACALFIAACGGGADPDPVESGSGTPTSTTSATTAEPTGEPVGDAVGTFTGSIMLDGTTTRVSFDRVDWSGVDTPITPSGTCSPDFFGGGRWFARGFAVDDKDAIVAYNDGLDFGTVEIDLPPDTWADEERDPPEFTIDFGDGKYRIATEEEAAGGPMSWTIGETTLAGTATFVGPDGGTHTVDFDIECSGERSSSFDLDDLPDDHTETDVDLAAFGTGTFHDGDANHVGALVGRCIPADDGDPRNLSMFAMAEEAASYLDIAVTHHTPFTPPGSEAEDEIHVYLFVSRESLGIQFEGRIMSTDGETWYTELPLYDPAATPLENTSFTVTDTRVSGEAHDLEQSWPDAGAELASVTFDLELPAVATDC